ncbi:MAG: YheU family protein [Pseudohongiellaceae bacterium]
MKIPHTDLSAEALNGIIEEYVSREGTEYGSREFNLQEKVKQVHRQLEKGEAYINYDADTQTCHLVACNM